MVDTLFRETRFFEEAGAPESYQTVRSRWVWYTTERSVLAEGKRIVIPGGGVEVFAEELSVVLEGEELNTFCIVLEEPKGRIVNDLDKPNVAAGDRHAH